MTSAADSAQAKTRRAGGAAGKAPRAISCLNDASAVLLNGFLIQRQAKTRLGRELDDALAVRC